MSRVNKNYQNILLKVCGSIAAYKAAILCSKLVQKKYHVKVVCSENALKFIGSATFEGLCGEPPLKDIFETGRAMDHINLDRWADLTLVYPATANTINKLATGIGEDPLSTLFLAHDFTTPYLIAPAMNDKMLSHPVTQNSLTQLKNMGVIVLPTQQGALACGEYGYGRVLEPEQILKFLELPFDHAKKTNVLVCSGGTREAIDGVRFITNKSTGKTGASIADSLIASGHTVTFLCADQSVLPKMKCNLHFFTSHKELEEKIKSLLSSQSFDAVIHLAAVSDYSVESLKVNNEIIKPSPQTKLPSKTNDFSLKLKRNSKVIDKLKDFSQNKNIMVVGFKLTCNATDAERKKDVKNLFSHSRCDFVVHNDLSEIKKDQHDFKIFNPQMQNVFSCQGAKELGEYFSNEGFF